MLLAMDAGNTHIVFGCMDAGELLRSFRAPTRPDRSREESLAELRRGLADWGLMPGDFEGAILSSVVPPVNEALRGAAEELLGRPCLVVGPETETGMPLCVDEPETVGADLLVGCFAAAERYGKPCIVLDLGTATTVMAVDGEGRFRGGAILPGVKLSLRALTAGTSLLPDMSLERAPRGAVGTNTEDCLLSGAVYGSAAALDGLIDRMERELGAACRCVATGGIARHIVPYCRREILLDRELLFHGLWSLWQRNRPGD